LGWVAKMEWDASGPAHTKISQSEIPPVPPRGLLHNKRHRRIINNVNHYRARVETVSITKSNFSSCLRFSVQWCSWTIAGCVTDLCRAPTLGDAPPILADSVGQGQDPNWSKDGCGVPWPVPSRGECLLSLGMKHPRNSRRRQLANMVLLS
jgi:hypothetical protein